MINDKIDFVKSLPCPENIYYFFLYTNVKDIPKMELNYFFDATNASISFFRAFNDPTSKEAEKRLKTILQELYVRLEQEHIPDIAEPLKFALHERPLWEGLDVIWETYK